MLPTTHTMLDSPSKKIKDLLDAGKVEYDPKFSLKNYVRSAQTLLKHADLARIKGDMEGAFVNSLKATSIILEVVVKDKDYEKQKNDPELQAARKRVKEVMPDTEKIRELLQAKYESIHDIEASALATAAKAGKPKPPPRPSKPEFLSASRFDGQAPASSSPPSSAMSSSLSSSFSAPATPSSAHISSIPVSVPKAYSTSPLQSSFASLSMASSNDPSVPPPPTSLPTYKLLQPTMYNGSTTPKDYSNGPQSSSLNYTPSSLVGGMSSGITPLPTAAPISTTSGITPARSSGMASGLSSVSTTAGPAPAPVPAPRPPTHPVAPPVSAPGALDNGGRTAQEGSRSGASSSSTTRTSAPKPDSKPSQPLAIKPQQLLRYFGMVTPPSLLFIDVRRRVQYDSAKIKAPSIINIDPLALRDGVSSSVLAERGLFDNDPAEQKLFQERSKFDLVIYYDQVSAVIPTSGPLCNLVRALHELEFERPLARIPVLLEGGFNAWLECAGMDWVVGHDVDAARRLGQSPSPTLDSGRGSIDSQQQRPGSTPIPSDHQPQNHAIFTKLSRGGGINRHDGKIIRRNIEDYIKRDDGPQSMVNPRTLPPQSIPVNAAYPPRATPYSNLNAAASYPPAQPSYGNLNGSMLHLASNGQNGGGLNPNNAAEAQFSTSLPNSTGPGKSEYNGEQVYSTGPYLPSNPAPSSAGPGYSSAANYIGTNSGYANVGYPASNNQSNAGPTTLLQRRQTIYDNHWNNFGDKAFSPTATSPPIPAKIPIPGASMSNTATNTSAGPTLPQQHVASMTRPEIPSKPMRPLPQPPGMSDLRGYTQFGSNFSKMGSQLGKTGLTNLGNTCFMNSVIQCLIATPPLTRFFLDGSFKRHLNLQNVLGTQGRLAHAFADLTKSMWSGQSLVLSPKSFRSAIVEFAPQFRGSEQHDSQEFLSFLLDGLHEDLKAPVRPPPPGDDEGSEADDARMERMPEYEASELAWWRYLRRDNSIIVSLFQGQFRNRLCCSKCGKISTTYNAFMYLSLPIKAKNTGRQPQTLTSCLNSFVEPETMEGDNAWNCPHCKKPRKATMQMTISRVPDVLLIQLKRFSSDGPFKNKIKAMVQYPIQDLDLTKYLPSGAGGAPAEPALYDLYAVSNHSGEVSSGHYTACVRGEAPNSWTNFDDTRVSPCDKTVAVSEHGYTLFYVRKK